MTIEIIKKNTILILHSSHSRCHTFFLVCPTKDVTFTFLEKALSHININILYSLST